MIRDRLTWHKVSGFALETSAQQNQPGGGDFEIRLDGIDGPFLGSIPITASVTLSDAEIKRIILPVQPSGWLKDTSFHDLFFLVKNESKGTIRCLV